jgi:hypothetical protein
MALIEKLEGDEFAMRHADQAVSAESNTRAQDEPPFWQLGSPVWVISAVDCIAAR